MPPGIDDTRAALHRHPPYHAGSPSILVQSQGLAQARAKYATDPSSSRKPEPANFDSCLNTPLYDFDHPLTFLGCTSLHYSLGIGNDLFRAHEVTMKGYDAELSRHLELAEHDEDILKELEKLLQDTGDLQRELEDAHNSKSHHTSSLLLIDRTPGTEEARKKAQGRKTKVSLPYEAEYREQLALLEKCEKRIEAFSKKLERAQRDEEALPQKTPGIFEHRFLDYQNEKRLQKAAYHNENCVGNDIHAIMQPGAIDGFTNLMRPLIQTVVYPSGNPDKPVKFLVGGAGSHALTQMLIKRRRFGKASQLLRPSTPVLSLFVTMSSRFTGRHLSHALLCAIQRHSLPKPPLPRCMQSVSTHPTKRTHAEPSDSFARQ